MAIADVVASYVSPDNYRQLSLVLRQLPDDDREALVADLRGWFSDFGGIP